VTGDGINDAVIGTLFTDNLCYYLSGTDGEEKSSVPVGSPVDAISSIPDITGDGTMEVVVGLRNGLVYCFSGGLNTGVGIRPPQFDPNVINIETFPNPFSNETTLTFELESEAYVTIDVFDINGVEINKLLDNKLMSGTHSLIWDGNGYGKTYLPPGIYFYKAIMNDSESHGKLIKY